MNDSKQPSTLYEYDQHRGHTVIDGKIRCGWAHVLTVTSLVTADSRWACVLWSPADTELTPELEALTEEWFALLDEITEGNLMDKQTVH